jgi:hypothetical protein
MLGICRGVALTDAALRAVDAEIVALHVDATDLYDAAEPALAREAARRQEIVFLALDLLSGAVNERHALYAWLRTHGADDATLGWLAERRVTFDVLGINLYPMFTAKRVLRAGSGVRIRMVSGGPEIIEDLARRYAKRYDCPVMITETAALGSVKRRRAWLESSVRAVARLRAEGVPVVGYTWWPMFALVAWAYRQGRRTIEQYLLQMGLWDLDPARGLRRVPTDLVAAYQALVADGPHVVGPVAAGQSRRR